MYALLNRVLNGSMTMGYEVSDLSGGGIKYLSVEQVQGLAMAGALENVVYNGTLRRLEGINGFDLRRLPRKQQRIRRIQDNSSNVFTGGPLDELVKEGTKGYRQRFGMTALMGFLEHPCKGKVCALYGLRRTGKTTMMLHAAGWLRARGVKGIAYMTLTIHNTLDGLYKKIDQLVNRHQIEFLFIDEITAVGGFIQSSALLADSYAKRGVHIVLAGTDSYVLQLAGQDHLYDRMVKISTTYIGYREYEYLNEGSDIMDYIHMGGVLPADLFYDETRTNEYMETAISNNLINSIIRADNRKEHGHLLELDGRGLLKKAIEQAIAASNEELTTYVIMETYKNRDLGSAKQLMEAVFHIDDTLDTQEVEERVRYRLSIVKKGDFEASEEYVEELREFLIEIGVIKMYTRHAGKRRIQVPIFVQPGLRYHQTLSLLTALYESISFYEIPGTIREEFVRKILEDVEGNLIEHEVLLGSLYGHEGDDGIEVTQLNYKGKEVDMLICDGDNADLYEVKRSRNISERQYRWLIDPEFNDYIEKTWGCGIRDRVVLYLGEDTDIEKGGRKISYRNVSGFLKNPIDFDTVSHLKLKDTGR